MFMVLELAVVMHDLSWARESIGKVWIHGMVLDTIYNNTLLPELGERYFFRFVSFHKFRGYVIFFILTGQMTRQEAIERLMKPAYDPETIADDFEYIATKLGISVFDLEALRDGPKKYHWDYPNNLWLIDMGTKVMRATGEQRAVMR